MNNLKKAAVFLFLALVLHACNSKKSPDLKEETKQEEKVEKVESGPEILSNKAPVGWYPQTTSEAILFKANYPLISTLNMHFYEIENSKKPKITGTGKTFRPYGCKDSLNEIKELVGNKGDIYTTETVVSSTFDDGSVIYASCLSSGTFNIKSSMRSTWEVK